MDPEPGRIYDPITVNQKYSYVGNLPTLFTDPSGKSSVLDDFLNFGHNFIADFGRAFDALVKSDGFKIAVILTAAFFGGYFLGPIIAGAFGFASGTGAIIASTLWGAVVGGVIGGVGFTALGVGTFKDGFQLGAFVGGIGGGLNYGYHAFPNFNTKSPDLAVRLVGYGAKIVGIFEPLQFIPRASSCNDLSVDLSTSGLLGVCHD